MKHATLTDDVSLSGQELEAEIARLLDEIEQAAGKTRRNNAPSKEDNGRLLSLVQMLTMQNQRLRSDSQHERELRGEQIESLRRELADSQEKTELRLRLELSEKLRQLPPRE